MKRPGEISCISWNLQLEEIILEKFTHFLYLKHIVQIYKEIPVLKKIFRTQSGLVDDKILLQSNAFKK